MPAPPKIPVMTIRQPAIRTRPRPAEMTRASAARSTEVKEPLTAALCWAAPRVRGILAADRDVEANQQEGGCEDAERSHGTVAQSL